MKSRPNELHLVRLVLLLALELLDTLELFWDCFGVFYDCFVIDLGMFWKTSLRFSDPFELSAPEPCNRGDTILHHGGLHTDLNQCNQGS